MSNTIKCANCPKFKPLLESGLTYCSGNRCELKVRADERRKFAIWLDKKGYMRKMDLNISRIEEALCEYEKEHNND